MALVGNMIATASAGNPSLINYDMFVAVFGMLSLFYLIASAVNDSFSGHAAIPLLADTLNVLFLFCGAVAMAAELDVHSCSNSVRFPRLTSGSIGAKFQSRDTQKPITLQMAHPTRRSAVKKPKQRQHFCGSLSPLGRRRWSSPSSAQEAQVSTSERPESGKVRPLCLKSKRSAVRRAGRLRGVLDSDVKDRRLTFVFLSLQSAWGLSDA